MPRSSTNLSRQSASSGNLPPTSGSGEFNRDELINFLLLLFFIEYNQVLRWEHWKFWETDQPTGQPNRRTWWFMRDITIQIKVGVNFLWNTGSPNLPDMRPPVNLEGSYNLSGQQLAGQVTRRQPRETSKSFLCREVKWNDWYGYVDKHLFSFDLWTKQWVQVYLLLFTTNAIEVWQVCGVFLNEINVIWISKPEFRTTDIRRISLSYFAPLSVSLSFLLCPNAT